MTPSPVTADRPARPAFRDGAVLRAADLRNEAADRIAALARHQEQAHRPGIAAGLWLSDDPPLHITPGMAVDRCGRWLLVPGEYPLEHRPVSSAWEVWLAYREAPTEIDKPPVPPGRLGDAFEVIFHLPGEFDPADLAAHPEAAVFLGAVHDGKVSNAGRVYVGALGARVVAASRTARVLLAPEWPADTRRFAIGTARAGDGQYVDQLTLEDTGTLRVNAPIDVAGLWTEPFAALVAGHQSAEFLTDQILDPAALADRLCDGSPLATHLLGLLSDANSGDEGFKNRVRGLLRDTDGVRRARLICQVLNAAVFVASSRHDRISELVDAVRASGAVFRSATVRELRDRAAGLARANAPRLARLLLEDAFPGHLCLRANPDAPPHGVTFSGTGPGQPAAPGRAYLADVADKAGKSRELRVTIEDPGKDNHPGRYKAAVGFVSPDPGRPDRTTFTAVLEVDATETVTIPGNLLVYPDYATFTRPKSKPTGLILKRTPPGSGDPNDPAAVAARLTQVGPRDLRVNALEEGAIVRPGSNRAVVLIGPPGYLENAGNAPIQGARLDVVAFSQGSTKHDPVRRTLFENLTIGPGQQVRIQDADRKLPFAIPLGPHKDSAKVSVVLVAVGAGPGGILAGEEVRWDET